MAAETVLCRKSCLTLRLQAQRELCHTVLCCSKLSFLFALPSPYLPSFSPLPGCPSLLHCFSLPGDCLGSCVPTAKRKSIRMLCEVSALHTAYWKDIFSMFTDSTALDSAPAQERPMGWGQPQQRGAIEHVSGCRTGAVQPLYCQKDKSCQESTVRFRTSPAPSLIPPLLSVGQD